MTENEITHIGFLILPSFPMACLTSMIEPLRVANEIADRQIFRWSLLGETSARIESSAAIGFEPDAALDDAQELTHLIVLSMPISQFENPNRSNGILRRMARHGTVMGAISGGIFPLARAGLMEGHLSSVHWCYAAAFQAEFGDLETTDDVIVCDRRRMTASGAGAAFDLGLQLIEEKLGPDIATEVACWFQHPLMRGEGVRQRVPAWRTADTADMMPDLVAGAIALFADRLDNPISVAETAKRLGVSSRQLERKFKAATGQTPLHYYRVMRLNAARQMVMYSKDSVSEIALAVGYASAGPLVAHYRDAFGLTPSQDRRKVNQFRVEGKLAVPSL